MRAAVGSPSGGSQARPWAAPISLVMAGISSEVPCPGWFPFLWRRVVFSPILELVCSQDRGRKCPASPHGVFSRSKEGEEGSAGAGLSVPSVPPCPALRSRVCVCSRVRQLTPQECFLTRLPPGGPEISGTLSLPLFLSFEVHLLETPAGLPCGKCHPFSNSGPTTPFFAIPTSA